VSPPGTDGGVDILAGNGPLGFSEPNLCVQVKSGNGPLSSNVVNELRGAMQNTGAKHGLLVSWDGFKPTVYKQSANAFFALRLWRRVEILEQLFATYDKLDDEIKAELPLKRIWTVANQDDE
jgi:restriction system protein